MTWKEFKDTVDKELLDSDLSEDIEIFEIQVTDPNSLSTLRINLHGGNLFIEA